MALTYNFYADREIAIADLNDAAKKASLSSNQSDPYVDIAHMRVSDYKKETIEKQYGFRPESGILFSLDKFAEGDSAFLEMARLAMVLFEKGIENAILIFDGEIPVFLKHGERLILNSSRSFWDDPIRLEQIKGKHEFQPLTNLE